MHIRVAWFRWRFARRTRFVRPHRRQFILRRHTPVKLQLASNSRLCLADALASRPGTARCFDLFVQAGCCFGSCGPCSWFGSFATARPRVRSNRANKHLFSWLKAQAFATGNTFKFHSLASTLLALLVRHLKTLGCASRADTIAISNSGYFNSFPILFCFLLRSNRLTSK